MFSLEKLQPIMHAKSHGFEINPFMVENSHTRQKVNDFVLSHKLR